MASHHSVVYSEILSTWPQASRRTSPSVQALTSVYIMLANVPLAKGSHTAKRRITVEGDKTGTEPPGNMLQWIPPIYPSSTWPLKVQLPITAQESHIGLDEASLEDEEHSRGCTWL